MTFNSSTTRRQIGITKKRLLQLCEIIKQVLDDFNVDEKAPQLTYIKDEELSEFRSDLTEQRSQLYNAYLKIQKLDEEWLAARSSDKTEEDVFNDYINRCGHYNTAVQNAVSLLEKLDDIFNALDREFIRRQLPLPTKDEEKVTYATQIQSNKNENFHNTAESTINFVDASILSRLNLPVFDGNLLEYPEFMARYTALIGGKRDLDDATKFSLLKSCLKGRALQSIQGLALTSKNYTIALDILKSRYDDKVTIRHILFTQLANLPQCDEEGKHLQSLYNKMYSLTRQFCSYGDDTKEIALGAILLNKLPRYVRSMIYDKAGQTHNLTPSELLQALTSIVHKEATLREMEFHCKGSNKFEDNYFATHRKFVSPPNFGRRFQPLTKKPENAATLKRRQRACPFCNSYQHAAVQCDRYQTTQERLKIVKEKQLCFNCLSPKHRTKDCTSIRTCQKCSRRHHTSICSQNSSPSQRATNQYRRLPKPENKTKESAQIHFADNVHHTDEEEASCQINKEENDIIAVTEDTLSTKKPTLLMCVDVKVFNPDAPEEEATTMAFFDSGSSKSYITSDLADQLHLPQGEVEQISIQTFASGTPIPLLATLHTIGICTTNGKKILCVKAINTLTNELKIMQLTSDTSPLPVASKKKPSLLIGADYFWELLLSEEFYIRPYYDGYHLVHSSVGNIITGKAIRPDKDAEYSYISSEPHMETLENLVEKLWSQDFKDSIDDDQYDKDDKKCMMMFNESIYYDTVEERYVVQLPFKGDKRSLPNNIQLAYARLLHNIKNLKRNPETMDRYHRLIQDQLIKGIIEEVHETKLPELCHYLPHHPVISEEKKTTKLRCVYDGSAKTKGNPSLNELLFRGPVFLPDITGILIRARLPKILIASDIEKAFLMVGLNKESRDFTRFLWLKDPKKPVTQDNIITYRFCRVPFGLISSPFLLAGTIHYHLQISDSPLAKEILENTYVDNVFHGVNTVEDGKLFYENSKQLFQKAGMNLRQFVSNSEELNDFLSKKEKETIDAENKILGISWNIKDDTLSLSLPKTPPKGVMWTKRKILRLIASTYDPLGWCSPALFESKLFLQSLWKQNLQWDDMLPSELITKWNTITAKWTILRISIPRQILSDKPEFSTFQLHVFTDASSMGYCAVAYLVEKEKTQKSTILMSKNRLSPSKKSISIPRLELSAIALGSQLLKHIRYNLQHKVEFEKIVLWSDSSVALMWIKGNKNLPVFIRNRIAVIKTNAPKVELRYVPGEMNPADVGSRGISITDLKNFDLWWRGPTFITQSENQWPADITSDPTEQCCHTQTEQSQSIVQQPIIDPTRFSSWRRILGTMQKVLLYLTCKATKIQEILGKSSSSLFKRAQVILFRFAQMQNPPSEEIKRQLNLFYNEHDGLWKSKGRIANANLPEETTTPIFLPRENYITLLFVLHIHHTNNHSEINHTLMELRQTTWIPKGRLTVKRVINKMCYHCRRLKAQPYKLPPFPPHPSRRVQRPKYPFENSGMDYAGPLPCKTNEDENAKYWILLLTCLNTRAIYVDLVLDMSARTLLQALRRFFASTAYPKWILCDNAKSFKTINEIQDHLQFSSTTNKDIIDFCAQRMIEFKFIPSFSPWQGGLYEKMVHIFKISFKHSLNNRKLDFEELRTIAKETETIVNSRPLTYVVEDDKIAPLRPIDFLHPWATLSPPRVDENFENFIPTTMTKEQLLDDWKFMNMTLNRFWKRWTSEYLTNLREQFHSQHPHPRVISKSQPKENEYVLIQEKSLERGQWKIGQIVSSSDQYQRSANVRLPSHNVITRPINMLYKFEIQDESQSVATEPPPQEIPRNRHPMMTRSKTSTNTQHVLFTITLILMFMRLTLAHRRCPSEINTPKTLVYATNCISKGLAIAKYTLDGKSRLCWFPILCPNGAIRVSLPFQHNEGLCGPRCRCPAWASSCSFSSSPRRKSSKIQNLPLSISSYRPSHVCSFSPSTECDTKKRIGSFNQVELYDNTLLVVPELRIAVKDYLDPDDYLCFDIKGTQKKATTPYTGSSYFCNKNQCDDNASTFCTFGTPSAIFTTSNNSFLVKAWGVTVKEYYGYQLTDPDQKMNSAHCHKGGIYLIIRTPTNAAEICIDNYCHFIQNPTNSSIIFPNSLVTFSYTVHISSWSDGILSQQEKLQCGSYPVCELIDCTICRELLYNPDCWTTKQMSVTLGIALVLLFTICLLLPAMKMIFIIGKIPPKVLHFILKKCFALLSKKKAVKLPAYTGHRRRLLIAILICLAKTTSNCSDVITFSTTEETCTKNEMNETCTFDHATVMTLQPLNQETCLLLRNNNNIPLGMITIRVTGIYFTCHKKVEFYTRDHQINVESVHRCRYAGSCQSTTCDSTTTTDKIKEFSRTANEHPGYKFCSASCGCLTCKGCFFCLSSCLFYRYYALPKSSEVYTVFNCPTWEFTVEAQITIHQGEHIEKTNVRLIPGETFKWNSLRLSLIGTMVPQFPVLSSTFVTNGKITASSKPAFRGNLIPNTIGQLQCGDYSKAQKFDCSFSANTCSCSPAINQVSCSCGNGDIKKLIAKSALPLMMKNIMIYQKEKEIVAKTNVGSAIQLHVIVENMRLTSTRQNTTCTLMTSEMSGCYNCISGAHANVSCQSKAGEITAQVICGNQQQIVICTPSGHINEVIFIFDSSHVEENCTLLCPGGAITFVLKGQLHYIEDAPLLHEETIDISQNETNFTFTFSEIVDYLKIPVNFIVEIFSSFSHLKFLFIFFVFIVLLLFFTSIVRNLSVTLTAKKTN